MPDLRTDQIAREAARLMHSGRLANIPDAIQAAMVAMKLHGVPLPGAARVRKHVQAMSMQSAGQAAFNERQEQALHIAEQVMTVFEHTIPDAEMMLAGRAARGEVLAGDVIHIRLYTRWPVSEIASALVDMGYEEPTFHTIETQHGRLNQVRFHEDGIEVAVTRCLPELRSMADVDLTTGKPIETLTMKNLRRKLDEQA